MRRWRWPLAGATLATVLLGCTAADPDAELRAVIEAAENAAEARDTGFFRELVSESYVDARGRRRDDVIGLVRGYFLVNGTVEIVKRIDEIALAGDDAATVILQAAVLARSKGESVLGTDANYHRLTLELVREDGTWRLIGADWGDE